MKTRLLMKRMSEYLADRVPTVAEQVHLKMIQLKDMEDAKRVKERLDRGEDFAALAREYSLDDSPEAAGGEYGWFPRAALPMHLAIVVFDELKVGEVGEPFYLDDQHLVVVMVAERVAAREIDDDTLKILKDRALGNWFEAESPHHKIEFHGFSNGYDSETDAWVRWQLHRMKKK
jgi:hypothetical protein